MRYNLEVQSETLGTSISETMARSKGQAKTLFAFGINHKTAPVEIRERLYLRDDEIPAFLDKVKGDLSECMVLSTCNRTEVYAVSDSPNIDVNYYKDLLIDFKDARGVVTPDDFFSLISCASCQQLFNVAASIDSQVIGDSQILRQIRHAYMISQENGSTGKILHQLLQRACKLGKLTYRQTSIHDGAASVSLAAVEQAVETLGSIRGRKVLIIGAGEMARTTAEALISRGAGKIVFTNRTRANAEKLVANLMTEFAVECEILDFSDFKKHLSDIDIVVSSTGSEDPILYKQDFPELSGKQLVIDIAVPRDIDPAVADVPNVILKNIDDLRSIIDGAHEKRTRDLPKVHKLIVNEMVDFLTWYYSLPIMPDIERTGTKPTPEEKKEIIRVKQFLQGNLSEIHRLAAKSGGDFNQDLESHFSLIRRLQTMKAQAFANALL